jgi:dTDP-4-dehydrorhamnose reductase
MKERILITGGKGLVGSNFLKELSKNKDYDIYSLDKNLVNFNFCQNIQKDILDKKAILELKKFKFNLIIHCAALADISFCELNEKLAYDINVCGTMNIAELAKISKSKLVYLSTDAIFDGNKGNYTEEDVPNPLNVYGNTKLEGERKSLEINDDTLIIRTNLFGKNIFQNRPSFIESVLEKLSKNEKYSAFYDVINSPIYVKSLIQYIMCLYKSDKKGIFNVCASESLSRYEFTKLIANIWDYDSGLITKESVSSLYSKDKIKRGKNLSLVNSKLLKSLKLSSLPTINEMLLTFKKDFYIDKIEE